MIKKFLVAVALLLTACGVSPVIDSVAEASRIKLHGKNAAVTIPVITSNGGGATATITITTAQTAVTTVTATGTTPITYTKSGADTALFSINASTGVLALLVPQAAADYHVTVTATNTGGADSQNITLTVAPVIVAPTITSNGGGSTATVNITTAQTAVTTVTATGSAPITYSIFGGLNAGLFTINSSTGVLALSTTQAIGSYEVIVRASNTGGTDNQTITVAVAAPGGAVAFTHVPIGGAGATIGVSSVPSAGTYLARTDQYNCYIHNGSQWVPLLKATNTPAGSSPTDTSGAAAISSLGGPLGNGSGGCVADPLTGTNIWVETNGGMFVSTDSGATFSGSCYTAQSDLGPSQTQQTKNWSHVIAVDPANSDIVYMGTQGSSLYTTFDKGATCFAAPSVAAPSAIHDAIGGNYLIAFDTSGGTTATCPHSASLCTKNVYVSVWGTGVYKSTNGGISFALTTSTPTTHVAMTADPFGNVWFVDNPSASGGGTLRKYNGSTWSTPTGTPSFAVGVDVDPNACASAVTCHIAVQGGGGVGSSSSSISTNGGASFNTAATITTVAAAGEPQWIPDFINGGFGQYPAGAAFDASGRVLTGGEGVFRYTPQTSGSAVTWNSYMKGIEESLSTSVVTSVATTGKVHLATWDLNCFVNMVQPYAGFPTTAERGCYNTNYPTLQHTYNIDWASADTSFFVAVSDNQAGYGGAYQNFSGKSTDSGVTWTALSLAPAVTYNANGYMGGCIAASSSTNYIHAPTDGRDGSIPPFYTTDGGTTWAPITVTGRTGTLATNATTLTGSAVLHFAATVPAYIQAGMSVSNLTSLGSLVSSATVISKTTTSITISSAALTNVGSGNTILFSHGGYSFRVYANTKNCSADRVTANTFYIYNWNDGVTGDALIRCISGGTSCSIQSSPNLGVNSQYFGTLKTAPGNAGHVFLSNAGLLPVGTTYGTFMYSTDAGVTFTTVTGMKGVTAFGFGAAFAGHTYPAIVLTGVYNGVYGIWQSQDWDGAKTWQKIGDYPLGLAMNIADIDGDKVIENVFYYTGSSGTFCSATSTSYCNGGT